VERKPQVVDEMQVKDFMLAEYEMLRSVRADLISLGESRVNFFLATVTGTVAGLGLMSQSKELQVFLPFVAGVLLVGLFILGQIIFLRTIERDIGISIYARGMNLVRRYFVTLNPSVKDFVILPINDDTPSFKSVGFLPKGSYLINLSGVVTVVNSIIATVAIVVLTKAITTQSVEVVVALGVVVFSVVYLVQHGYHVMRLRQMDRRTKINFPSVCCSVKRHSVPSTTGVRKR
jgi:hypothetical protein